MSMLRMMSVIWWKASSKVISSCVSMIRMALIFSLVSAIQHCALVVFPVGLVVDLGCSEPFCVGHHLLDGLTQGEGLLNSVFGYDRVFSGLS